MVRPAEAEAERLRTSVFPELRIVGEAFTVEGHDIPRVGWDEGIVRMKPYLDVFERLTPDSVLVSTTPGGPANTSTATITLKAPGH